MINNKKPTIIWDWNGTLIDDIQICIQSMNSLLRHRNKQELTYERYRDIFTFPVKDYYLHAGFDFSQEPFEKPAMEFIDAYHNHLPNAQLFPSVVEVLSDLSLRGFNQIIVSAMEEQSLKRSVNDLGINSYFDIVAGINDHYATSKILRGRQIIEKFDLDVRNMVFIGDTLHDKEVADALGCDCVLVSKGHQSVERLALNGNTVAANLKDAYELIDRLLD